MLYKSVSINSINVYPFESVDELLTAIQEYPRILVAVNAEKILHATEEIKAIINNHIGFADGIVARMLLRKQGYAAAIKIPGCELWLEIIRRHCANRSFYFVGGRQEVIEETARKLKLEFPLINIAGFRNGYFDDNDKQKLLSTLREKKPDIIFVAMGSPKQEILMREMYSVHPAIYQGLGGSFDIYTDHVKRAPQWWINHNLEWAYRLITEPRRIKRQIHLIKCIPLFFSKNNMGK
jgi:UDP-N-acetyl-D-mannosaminouronate:lipid I N-acetyl-D-mannosaminouronosyltransferase